LFSSCQTIPVIGNGPHKITWDYEYKKSGSGTAVFTVKANKALFISKTLEFTVK
jgi:hypothetical protein